MYSMSGRRISLSNNGRDPLMRKKKTTALPGSDPLTSQPFRPSLELTFHGHRSRVLAACFKPSLSSQPLRQQADTGDIMPHYTLSCGVDGSMFLWSSKTTTRAMRFVGNSGPIYDCVWIPHTQLIANAGHDGFIRLWRPSLRLGGGPPMPSVKDSSSENCGCWRAHTGPVRALAIAPHEDQLYTAGDDKSVKCWDLNCATSFSSCGGGRGSSNKFVSGFTGGHQNWVRSVAVSGGNGNGKGQLSTRISLVASGGDDRTVQVWDTRSRRPTHTFFEHTDAVYSVDFHPDGCSLATGSADHTINLFDLRKNGLLQHYDAHDGCVNEVRFAPTGSWLLSASSDGKVKLWDLKEGYLYCTLNAHEGAVHTARFSETGKYFTTAGQDGIVMVWRSEIPSMHTQPQGNGQEWKQKPFSYATHCPNSPSCTHDGQSHAVLPTSAALSRSAEMPLPLFSETGTVSFSGISPRLNSNRGCAVSTEVDARAPGDNWCPMKTSKNCQSGQTKELQKTSNIDAVSKVQGGYAPPSSVAASQMSFSSSQKPPLAQPSCRSNLFLGTRNDTGAAEVLPFFLTREDDNKGGHGGGDEEEIAACRQRHAHQHVVPGINGGRQAVAFARDDDDQQSFSPRWSHVPKSDQDEDKQDNCDGKREAWEKYKKDISLDRQQRNHNRKITAADSIELKQNDSIYETGTACTMDEEVSVLEYIEKASDDVVGNLTSGQSLPPHSIDLLPTGNFSVKSQEGEQCADDRMGRLEMAYARLTTEVVLAQKHSVDIAKQMQEQWEEQQRRQRGEMDQLRLIMEGLVAQQDALLQALRRE